MKTIQMTIDEELLCRVDDVTKELGVNRSAFLREALAEKLHRFHMWKSWSSSTLPAISVSPFSSTKCASGMETALGGDDAPRPSFLAYFFCRQISDVPS